MPPKHDNEHANHITRDTVAESHATPDDTPPSADFGNRYDLGDVIGRGGMGAVFECRDSLVHRDVAMKVDEHGEGGGGRFLREARLQGQLEHPNVVPIYDLGSTRDGHYFFTMKRIRGETMKDLLALPTTEYPLRRALGDFGRVCEAVAYAHKKGIVHRDIKPSNIMVGEFGAVYIIDWGIAKQICEDGEDGTGTNQSPTDVNLTRTGAMVGTPAFMAPEQRQGQSDERSDIYSLGLVGKEILQRETTPPPELLSATDCATDEAPNGRFQHVQELYKCIEAYLDGDRDEQRRQEIAEGYLATAQELISADQISRENYQRAVQNVGRALALSPDHKEGLDTLVRLMDRNLDVPPKEVVENLEASRGAARAKVTYWAMLAYAGALVSVLPFVWAGLRSWAPLLIVCAGWLAAITVTGIYGRRAKMRASLMIPILVVVNVANAASTLITGWLVLLPAFVALSSACLSMYMGRRLRWLVFLLGSLALVIPAAAFTAGIVPDAIMAGSEWPLAHLQGAIDLRTTIALIVTGIAMTLATTLYFGSVGDALERAELELHTRTWKLHNLAPGFTNSATGSPAG